MLKITLQGVILLTLVRANELPELSLPGLLALGITLSLRITNKAARGSITITTGAVMTINAFGLFYLLLLIYKRFGFEDDPILEALCIGLLSNEIVNEAIKLSRSTFKKWLANWVNILTAKDERN